MTSDDDIAGMNRLPGAAVVADLITLAQGVQALSGFADEDEVRRLVVNGLPRGHSHPETEAPSRSDDEAFTYLMDIIEDRASESEWSEVRELCVLALLVRPDDPDALAFRRTAADQVMTRQQPGESIDADEPDDLPVIGTDEPWQSIHGELLIVRGTQFFATIQGNRVDAPAAPLPYGMVEVEVFAKEEADVRRVKVPINDPEDFKVIYWVTSKIDGSSGTEVVVGGELSGGRAGNFWPEFDVTVCTTEYLAESLLWLRGDSTPRWSEPSVGLEGILYEHEAGPFEIPDDPP